VYAHSFSVSCSLLYYLCETYKEIVTKKRNRAGNLKLKAYADDAEDEMDTTSTTGTKLTFVASNMHCEDFEHDEFNDGKELRKFDVGDMAFLDVQLLGLAGSAESDDAEDTRKEFVNRIEAFEDNVKKKNDELLVKLREKYVGVRMHDVDPGESDDSQDSGYDEIRQVTNVEYQKRVKGQQQGYYVHTALVKEDGKGLDTSAESGERYFINEGLHQLLH
jgi:hypothetical protein